MRLNQVRTLTIILPALNEEEAIGGTLRRCLDARAEIQRVARLDAIEIIVVSDGSTDRTVEIARRFEDIQVIVFEKNQGYGAAIKEGFARGNGSLVGFIDADGTCDPLYFGEMCRQALDEEAEVVLGSRMGADSKMPRIRRIGNLFYAILLGILCGRRVTDTARCPFRKSPPRSEDSGQSWGFVRSHRDRPGESGRPRSTDVLSCPCHSRISSS